LNLTVVILDFAFERGDETLIISVILWGSFCDVNHA